MFKIKARTMGGNVIEITLSATCMDHAEARVKGMGLTVLRPKND